MNEVFKVGYAKTNVNPPMGIDIRGYFVERFADGILDDLEAIALALELGKKRVLLITVDNCSLSNNIIAEIREKIYEKVGVPADAILIHSTHTHTGPRATIENGEGAPIKVDLILKYREFLISKLVEISSFALADLKPAKMGYAVSKAPNISFVRRFKMKDGSFKTNPGVNNPDILEPVGEIDDSVNVLRFDREGAETIVLVNFGDHPDVVGGTKISGDWPTLTRIQLEKAIDNTKCIFFNGAQGDINHVNVHPKDGDLNGMFLDFDDVSRGYPHAIHMARVVAGAVMQVYEKVKYVEVDSLNYQLKSVDFFTNKGTPEELVLAHKYNDLHLAGKDDEIPFKAMMLTTVVAEAGRMVEMENAPEKLPMLLTAISIGKVGFIGIPGEPFNEIGKGLKTAEGYDMVLPCCLTGNDGYFPMSDSYDQGGYEGRSSRWKRGTGEQLIAEGKKLLEELQK